jgi:hypothetical protein
MKASRWSRKLSHVFVIHAMINAPEQPAKNCITEALMETWHWQRHLYYDLARDGASLLKIAALTCASSVRQSGEYRW